MTRIYTGVMALLLLLVALAVALIVSPQLVRASNWQAEVDPWVIESASSKEATEFIVFLREQADLSLAQSLQTKLEKGTYVFETLSTIADRTQVPVITALEELGAEYRSYWVANMLWVRADLTVVETMARRADVAHVYANPSVRMQMPEQAIGPDEAPDAIEWNITKVNADDVWNLGYTGEGVVIGGQDTGYDWDHPALKNQYRGWENNSADHNYSWHDSVHSGGGSCGPDSSEPCDDHGHGTHTMGTMVGYDGGSNQIGMAPGARWIGCRNMDQGAGTPVTYAECYEWFIAPTDLNDQNPNPALAPHAINNSWSCPVSEGCDGPEVLLTVVDNVRAAGILTAHSAANGGPGCSTINAPAAIYDSSFTVAATTSSDNVASYSSRGPVTVDGSGRPKPDIAAPGSGIRSSIPGGGYASGWSGTSMAAPHVAGQAALMISADMSLAGQVDELEAIMEQTAFPLSSTQNCGGIPGNVIPNNIFGYGRIDALSAVMVNYAWLNLTKNIFPATYLKPGDLITYTIAITNSGNVTASTTITDNFDSQLINPMCNGVPGNLADQQDIVADSSMIYHCISQVNPALSIEIDKVVDNPAPIAGTAVTYTITVTNPNLSAAIENLIVNDQDVGTCTPNLTTPIQLDPLASQVYICPNVVHYTDVTKTAVVTAEVPIDNIAIASAPEDANSPVSSNMVHSLAQLFASDSASVTVLWPEEYWIPILFGE